MKKIFEISAAICLMLAASAFAISCNSQTKGQNEPQPLEDFTETVMEGFTLSPVIADHMVIQRGKPFCVWGKAAAGVKVMAQASWAEDKTYGGVADSTGLWKFYLPTAQYIENDPNTYSVRFHNASTEQTISDLVVGDVWVLCGQSNMGISVGQAKDAEVPALAQEIGGKVRFFTPTGHEGNEQIQEFYQGAALPWSISDSVSVKNCSAIGYSFALNLAKTLNVPIGIVNVSMGACTLQSFMPVDELVRDSTLKTRYYDPFIGRDLIVGYRPGWMYNSLVHPMRHISKVGFLWYQGEGNTTEWDTYAYAQAKMMECWRERFSGEMDAPYYYVQLSSYKDDFRYVREAQGDVRNYTTNTGMAVSFDRGDYDDIHPTRKAEVGYRASLLALSGYYGLKDIVCEGPRFDGNVTVEDGFIKLSFSSADGLTTSDGNAPKYFEIRPHGCCGKHEGGCGHEGCGRHEECGKHQGCGKHEGCCGHEGCGKHEECGKHQGCGSNEGFFPVEAEIHGNQVWLKLPCHNQGCKSGCCKHECESGCCKRECESGCCKHKCEKRDEKNIGARPIRFDIRYAFIPYCEPNLYNAAGLPAEQFRTDK